MKVGAIARTLLSTTHCNLMVLQHGEIIERPVVVTFDDSETSQNALSLATRLAQQDHNALIVLFPVVNDHRYLQLYKRLMEELNDTVLQIYPVRLTGNTEAQILQEIKQYHGRIYITGNRAILFNGRSDKGNCDAGRYTGYFITILIFSRVHCMSRSTTHW